MKDEQAKKQIEEFKKVIESCHVNILIGSGASMPFLETLGNVERNITYIDNHSVEIGENLDLLKCSIYWEYLNKCILGNLFFLDSNVKHYVQKCEVYVFKLKWTDSYKSLRRISDYKFINFC